MLRRLLLPMLVVLATTTARADVTKEIAAIDARLKTCADKDSSTAGMNQCTDAANAAADKILTRLYRAAVAKLKQSDPDQGADNKEILKRLVAAERAWIAYRDAECSLQATQMLGGSGEGVIVTGCIYDMTKGRVKALDELFSAEK